MNSNSSLGFRLRKNRKTLDAEKLPGLERLCSRETDAIWASPPEQGIERIEAQFCGNGFEPHRHDTYAIGLTLAGVQSFWYRGESRVSLPGQVIVIHPDELHDGGAGTENSLRYRMIYVPPEKIADALRPAGGSALPFVASPVLTDRFFQRHLLDALSDIGYELGDLKRHELLVELATCLKRHSGALDTPRASTHLNAIRACGEFLRESCCDQVRIEDLEIVSGLDRFTLIRKFKSVFGTSPHRFLIMRRLESVKKELRTGASLSEAAHDSGFADQSHMSRHFKKAFGMAPGRWRRLNSVASA